MKLKKIDEKVENLVEKIFSRRTIKKGFTERELKEMLENDNFYKPETIWFTKEMIEADIPRLNMIFKEHGY